MSTALVGEDRFCRVFLELKKYAVPEGVRSCSSESGSVYRAFGLDPFKDGRRLETEARIFAEELYLLNQLAYQRAYPDEGIEILKVQNWSRVRSGFLNPCEFLKALRCIRYNIYDNGGRASQFTHTIDRLDAVIGVVTEQILESIPEYQKAAWF